MLPQTGTNSFNVSKIISWFFLVAGIFLVLTQFWLVVDAARKQTELDKPMFSITKLKPDKTEYHPGDAVHFTFERNSAAIGGVTFPVVLLTVDSFENQDTGEIFEGEIGARVIHAPGGIRRRATRMLPEGATPGIYILEGWARAEGKRLSQGVPFESEPFKVTPKP